MSTQAITEVYDTHSSNPAKAGAIYVLRAWHGGPLREFSEIKRSPAWLSYDHKGDSKRRFAGRYVCDLCQRQVVGVYEPNYRVQAWSCGSCRDGLTSMGDQ